MEGLSIELTKGSVSLYTFLPPKQTDTVSLVLQNKQLLSCLLPDRFDAREATRLCCHTRHTPISIRPFICFLHSTRPACCLSVTLSSDKTHACQTRDRPASADKPDKPAENFKFCPGKLPRDKLGQLQEIKMNYQSGFKAYWLYSVM